MNQQNQQQDVAIFNNPLFGDVEVLNLNGKFYFPASKVATILGYSNPRDAISRHCVTNIPYVVKHDVGVQTGIKTDGSPAIQMVTYTFIDEGNLYRLIARSKLPLAQQFERWVFDEVLPTIRQTGGIYMTDTMWEYLCSKPEMWGQILLDYGQLKNKWEEAQPKLERYDTFMESNYGYNMATASKILKFQAPQRKRKIIGRNQLFQILRELNILQSTTQNWNIPFQEYIDMGYFYTNSRNGNGERAHATVFVLPRGLEFVYDLLKDNGYEIAHRDYIVPNSYDNLTEAAM